MFVNIVITYSVAQYDAGYAACYKTKFPKPDNPYHLVRVLL